MELSSWILFAAAVAAATLSPGPNVLIVVMHSLRYGKRSALYTISGNLSALFIFALISALGIGTLLKTLPTLMFYFRLTGAAYLFYLGIKVIRAALTSHISASHVFNDKPVAERIPGLKLYQEAFICSCSNPKAILFLSAIFPQFINPKHTVLPQFTVMFITIIATVGLIHSLYALAAAKSASVVNTTKIKRRFSLFSGVCFIGFGLLLAPFKQAFVR